MSELPETQRGTFAIRCADAVELVTDYLDDALHVRDLAAFEAHLAGCEGCTIFVDQIEMTIKLASSVTNQQLAIMPANFDALVSELKQKATPPDAAE